MKTASDRLPYRNRKVSNYHRRASRLLLFFVMYCTIYNSRLPSKTINISRKYFGETAEICDNVYISNIQEKNKTVTFNHNNAFFMTQSQIPFKLQFREVKFLIFTVEICVVS